MKDLQIWEENSGLVWKEEERVEEKDSAASNVVILSLAMAL